MGYSIEYIGKININPPLHAEELEYLSQFVHMVHMQHKRGPYFLHDSRPSYGSQNADPDIINAYQADPTKPSYGPDWVFTDDGTAIEWGDRTDRFYLKEAIAWMRYLIEHFLKPDPIARQAQPAEFGFLSEHILNGAIKARIDEFNQNSELIVIDNIVLQRDLPKTAEQNFYYVCPHCRHTIPLHITIGPLGEH